MKLRELAKKPQLIKITIDDAEIVAEYGEAIEFWTWDRQPMDVFLKLSQINTEDPKSIVEIVRGLILDEDGQPIIEGDVGLPVKILMAVITKVVENLGK